MNGLTPEWAAYANLTGVGMVFIMFAIILKFLLEQNKSLVKSIIDGNQELLKDVATIKEQVKEMSK